MQHQSFTTTNNEPVFSLIAEEDNAVLSEVHRSFDKRRQGLYPSEASVSYMDGNRKIVIGTCNRSVWYRTNEIPKTNPGGIKLYQTGRIGKELEKMQVRLWKELGLWIANNIKFFNKDLVLSGELDAIVKNPMTGKLMGIEMKTHYEYPARKQIYGAKKEKGTGRFIAGQPKDNHFLQALLYAWEYRDVLDEFRLFYFERGTGERVEFRIGSAKRNDGQHQCYWEQIPGRYWNAFQEGKVLQPYTIEDLHKRYKDLIKVLRKKEMPERDFEITWDKETIEYKYSQGKVSKTNYDKWVKNPSLQSNQVGDWQCSYCDWKDQCKQDTITS